MCIIIGELSSNTKRLNFISVATLAIETILRALFIKLFIHWHVIETITMLVDVAAVSFISTDMSIDIDLPNNN